MAISDVVGHEHAKEFLRRAYAARRIPPALLLTGPSGVGKKLLAIEASRALLCEEDAGEACGHCRACGRSARRLHPDFFVVEPATPTSIKIEQVRELVREIQSRPFEARARGFVVDEAHLMTEEAANSLLKSLEEPPPTSRIILVTSAPHALLPTILSRCQMLRARPLPLTAVQGFLLSRGVEAGEARLRATLSGGSIGVALAFQSDAYLGVREEAVRALESATVTEDLRTMEIAESLAEADDPMLVTVVLRSLLRDIHALRAGAPRESLVNADVAPRLLALSRGGLGDRAAEIADAVGETREALRGNANRLLAFDRLLDVMRG